MSPMFLHFSRLPRLVRFWRQARQRLPFLRRQAEAIPDGLWLHTLVRYPFLAALPLPAQQRLRSLCAQFLSSKEFHGASGLVITDAMALAVAAQACLPLVYLPGQGRWRDHALGWYDDFVGIVVHPAEAVAQREVTDGAGVVHRYKETLLGEAMARGPVMLSWHHVAQAGDTTASGHNLVIHEFAHKFDMRGKSPSQDADGCPVLPAGFLGSRNAAEARRQWRTVWGHEYAAFKEKVVIAQRFGEAAPWLDGYGAHSPAEFFAVACEAYWVSRERFGLEFPALLPLLDGFFRPALKAS